MLVLLSPFPIHLYEVVVTAYSIPLLLEFPDRLLPSLSSMHLSLSSKSIKAELGNVHRKSGDCESTTEVPPLNSEAATRGVLCIKVFLKISQNSQENTCARISF